MRQPKSKPTEPVWAEWDKHIKAANIGEYDKEAGWLTVYDFAAKCADGKEVTPQRRQSASVYLKNGHDNGDFERKSIVLDGKRCLVYRPKVKP